MSGRLQIDGFELKGILGRGGMSTVWRAHQESLDRDVAIKVLAPGFSSSDADVARFFAEARAAARLKHPNIVQVYDAGAQHGQCFYVMEMVHGYDVGQWLRRKGRLSLSDALAVAESVAVALDHAWTAYRMVHCDIKPENVMVDADGTVKVTDLGLARMGQSGATCEDEDDAITGTPVYMSPEQATGETDLDCRTDIYALGAMLYHLTSGTPLFQGLSDDAAIQAQIEGFVPDVRERTPELPQSFSDLLEQMLAKRREERLQDWSEVLRDLRLVKHGLPPVGRQPPPGNSTMRRLPNATGTRPRARPPLRILGAILALLAALAVLAAAAHRLQRSMARKPTEPAPVHSTRTVAPIEPELPPVDDAQDRAAEPAVEVMPLPPEPPGPFAIEAPAESEPAGLPEPSPAPTREDDAWDQLATDLLVRGWGCARAGLRKWATASEPAEDAATRQAAEGLLRAAVEAEREGWASFSRQVGAEVEVMLEHTRRTGRVVAADGTRVVLEQRVGRGVVTHEFGPSDLHVAEQLRLLAPLEGPGAALCRGRLAWQHQAYERAAVFFSELPGPLGEALRRACARHDPTESGR